MNKKKIEFACTGNSGRSTIAELVGRKFIQDYFGMKAENVAYDIISSGTEVEASRYGDIPLESKKLIIQKALLRDDIYGLNDQTSITVSLRNNDEISKIAIDDFYGIALRKFIEEEHEFRAEAVKYFGIEGIVKTEPEQTIARPDTIAVISMAKKNNNYVKMIYNGKGFDPVINTLAGVIEQEDIPNAFGRTKEEYFATIQTILEYVPLAMEKLMFKFSTS